MTTIPPQPPPPPPPPAAAPRGLPQVTVTNAPAELAKLVAGTAIEGLVIGDAGKTAVQVQTVYGTLQIQTTLPLDRGARLTLVLQNLTQPVQLQLAAIDGKAPALALRAASGPTGGAAAAAGSTAQATGAIGAVPPAEGGPLAALRALVGTSLTAVLLRPIAPSTPLVYGPTAPTATTPGLPGTAQPGQPSPVVPPSVPGPSGAPGPPAGTMPTAPAAGHLPALTPFAGGLPPMAPGTQLAVRVVAVNPTPADPAAVPGAGPSTPTVPATPLLGQTMSAVVTGTTASGQPILRTPAGTFMLSTPAALPRGAELVIEVRSEPLLSQPAGGPPPPPRPFEMVQARAWPALAEAFQALQAANPAAAQQMAAATLPQANVRLAADVLFFLTALRGGDLGGWLGDEASRILRRDRPELLNRLGSEFRQIAAMAREPVTADWRVALVPFFTGSHLEQIRLCLRPYGGEEEEEDGPPQGVRFLVDVEFTRMGRLQLDGLVREDKKHFDLILRSDEPLPAGMRADIRAIFEQANEVSGVAGVLGFQAAPANFIELEPDAVTVKGPGLLA